MMETFKEFYYIEPASREVLIERMAKELERRGEIRFAYLFGSFLSEGSFRDVDVAIYVEEDRLPQQEVADYTMGLSHGLALLVTLPVEVQVLNYAPLGFKHSVLRHGRVLFSKDEGLRSDLIEAVSLEYMVFYEHSLEYLRDLIH
jgi:predicted nucleotidyltransferase